MLSNGLFEFHQRKTAFKGQQIVDPPHLQPVMGVAAGQNRAVQFRGLSQYMAGQRQFRGVYFQSVQSLQQRSHFPQLLAAAAGMRPGAQKAQVLAGVHQGLKGGETPRPQPAQPFFQFFQGGRGTDHDNIPSFGHTYFRPGQHNQPPPLKHAGCVTTPGFQAVVYFPKVGDIDVLGHRQHIQPGAPRPLQPAPQLPRTERPAAEQLDVTVKFRL
ncbi:hypothetical protein A6M21_02160 [Desulfotomaculum copahuensis]|uniref:Uncharacterized protein n=1 Tax=Desulfotomaculum copahuensis TaxID=1838280 RepID=A0A1B7LKT3_9FIRM|nr:hypothetical protein A6M21_02160 [Desulfotomaculum copahuensis]